MNVLVVGSPPPPRTARRAVLLDEVLRLRAEGHEVEVLGLDPLSCAHSYLAGPGIAAAVEVALSARRYDRVVVQIEPGLPVREGASRVERAASLLALSAALRLARDVTLRLEHLDDLPGGFGGRAAVELWKAPDHIEAGTPAVAEALGSLGGATAPVELAAGPPKDGTGPPSGGPPNGVGPPASGPPASGPPKDSAEHLAWEDGVTSRADAAMSIRRGAASERLRLAQKGMLPPAAADGRTRVPQWEWLPSPGAGVPDLDMSGSEPERSEVVLGVARRLARRLVAAAERRPASRVAAQLGLRAARQARTGLRRH